MGLYIYVDSDGRTLPSLGKVEALILDGAEEIEEPYTFEKDLVCVVNNGTHEAARYIPDSKDFMYIITHKDDREKTWLSYAWAKKLAE